MTFDVVTVTEDTPLKEASQRMVAARVSGLPVVDDAGRLVGIITEADFVSKEAARRQAPSRAGLLRLLFSERPAQEEEEATVAAAMTPQPFTISADADHTEAARLMEKHHVKRLPVLDGAGNLAGVISRADILNVFATPDEVVADTIREDIVRRVMWLDPTTVTVTVANGNVKLAGSLPTRTEARMLEALVRRNDGVVSVESRLTYDMDDRIGADSPPPDAPRPSW